MKQLQVVILAGAMRPSSLRIAVQRPVACLPLDAHTTVLEAWLRRLRALPNEMDVILATNEDTTLPWLNGQAAASMRRAGDFASIRVIRDPANWRGSAGVLHDLRDSFACSDGPLLVIECACLPPQDLQPLLNAVSNGAMVAIGATTTEAPAGVYASRPEALDLVPDIGYCDFKEQFIPRLRTAGHRIQRIDVAEEVARIRDLPSYLNAVRCWAGTACRADGPGSSNGEVGTRHRESGRRLGVCVVERQARVESGVILHDAIVLDAAVINSGAVVSQSVITGDAVIEAGQRVIRRMVTGSRARHAPAVLNGKRQIEPQEVLS